MAGRAVSSDGPAHAKLGASSAHRWLACPGSVNAEAGLSDKTSSFAEEGTRAHELAERVLREGAQVLDTVDDDIMGGFVREYVDYVLREADGAELFEIEQRVDYSDWVPGGFGTSDVVVVKGDTLHVMDLKYGQGVRVDAENNPQGMLYALGAYAENNHVFDIKTVRITIIQPRLDHISEWSLSIEDLLRWAEWVAERAEETQRDDAQLVPGDAQCRWCKAKPFCKALSALTEATIMAEFDDMDATPMVNRLTDAQLRVALDNKALIEGWLSAVQEYVKVRVGAGEVFPGYKLVEGRANRRWDGDVTPELTAIMGDDAYAPRALLTPAQAEKTLGKKRAGEIADLIVKPRGAPTIAPESDKRPAIGVSEDDFNDCTGDGDALI